MNVRVLGMGMVMLLATAACGHEGMDIQQQYAEDRDECREYAEQTGAPGNTMPTGREHVLLVSQFARCMNKRGWNVNKPSEETTKEAKKGVPLGTR